MAILLDNLISVLLESLRKNLKNIQDIIVLCFQRFLFIYLEIIII